MAPATHQPAPSDTKGNASRQLTVVVVVFGRRVAPALWRLTFAALISWVSRACYCGPAAWQRRIGLWACLPPRNVIPADLLSC
jgi:hypothetical protein